MDHDHGAQTPGRDLVESLASFPAELQRLLDDYPGEALRRPASDGGWSALDVLCHLRDWEEVFLERARAIIERDRPELPAYDDALWEIEHRYREQDPGATLARFSALRNEMVDLLAGLDARDWQREGNHGLLGPISVRWIAEYLAEHDRGHLDQIGDALH